MRNGECCHGNISNLKTAPNLKMFTALQLGRLSFRIFGCATPAMVRGFSDVNRDLQLARQDLQSGTWSWCSCEITMALSFCGSSPAVCMRLSVSRQEMPASTRMLAQELESTVEFPLLPLARTVMRIATERSITGIVLAGSSKVVNTRKNGEKKTSPRMNTDSTDS